MTPGIVLFPAIAGMNDYIHRTCAQLEGEGFTVHAVDYFAGAAAPDISTPQKIGAAVAALSDREVLEQGRQAVASLRECPEVDPSRIGFIGFCIGGTYAMLAACELDGISAVANYYGTVRYDSLSANKPTSPLDRAGDLRAPMIAHYGTADRFVPSADVAALEKVLDDTGRPYELFRYGGAPHAFDEDFRPTYRPVAAAEAWSRTLGFFNWYLRKQK